MSVWVVAGDYFLMKLHLGSLYDSMTQLGSVALLVWPLLILVFVA